MDGTIVIEALRIAVNDLGVHGGILIVFGDNGCITTHYTRPKSLEKYGGERLEKLAHAIAAAIEDLAPVLRSDKNRLSKKTKKKGE